jgi:PAS domain S-box-containing protein
VGWGATLVVGWGATLVVVVRRTAGCGHCVLPVVPVFSPTSLMVSWLKPDLALATAALIRRRSWHTQRGGAYSSPLPYLLALASVATAALLTAALWPLLKPVAATLFLAAIMVSAWAGGAGPGLAATALSTVSAELLFIHPLYPLEQGFPHVARIGIFILVGVLITALNAARGVVGDVVAPSDSMLQSALDSLSVQLAIIDRDGNIVAANAAWQRFFAPDDASAGGAVGRKYLDVWKTERGGEVAAIEMGMGDVLGKVRREFSGEISQWQGADRRWFAVRITRFEGDGGMRAVVAHEDITERKRAEEAERREESLRSVARLASAAAHEINNPLAIIMGNVEIIAHHIDESATDRIRPTLDAVERIRLIVQRMTRITNLKLSQQSPSLPEMLDLRSSSATLEAWPPEL